MLNLLLLPIILCIPANQAASCVSSARENPHVFAFRHAPGAVGDVYHMTAAVGATHQAAMFQPLWAGQAHMLGCVAS